MAGNEGADPPTQDAGEDAKSVAQGPGKPMPGESVAPSRLELGEQPEKMSKGKRFAYFIYNPQSGSVLGRTGMSWLRIFIFYIIFYYFLASFFLLTMVSMINGMNWAKPSMTGSEPPTILFRSNGLRVFPSAPAPLGKDAGKKEKMPSTTIFYNIEKPESYKVYVDSIAETVKNMKNVPSATGCAENDYGYKDGQPCILLRFNRAFDWIPKSMKESKPKLEGTSLEGYKDYIKYLKKSKSKLDVNDDFMKTNVGIHCMGDGNMNDVVLGDVEYFDKPGIPVKPFKDAANKHSGDSKEPYKWEWTPFIFVKLLSPRRNTLIQIVCKALEANMDLDYAKYGVGSVRFSLLIVDEKAN